MTEEQKERSYLSQVLNKIEDTLVSIQDSIRLKKDEIDYMNTHMEEHKRDMDHLEKNAMRETIHNYTLQGDHALDKRKRLLRLRDVPYFGRMDFREVGASDVRPVYVGVHNFRDEEGNRNMVYDWRAPVSSMFYDYEPGQASYESKDGITEGEILLKRQFRIRRGKMEYMLDSDITIHDDVLQKELNQASTGKMRNIVATIQREQNAIIRNEDARHLIIQGVAGSGKTSIALHRIAFLLYKFKDTISSEDILIISPNKIFASYIANVLPELGEETVQETSMEEIAADLFQHQIRFQGFFDQVAELLANPPEQLIERIKFKSTPELISKMDAYMVHLENTGFRPETIIINKKPVPDWFITEMFRKYSRMPLLQRFNEVVEEVVRNVRIHYKYEVSGKERTELHKTIRKMFPSTNLRMLYKGFYEWLGKPEYLKTKKGSTFEYNDVYPLLYLKMKLEGLKPYTQVKHLLVDEMQDYSAVQYKVLSALFPCKKTILGDINQSVNPFSSSNMDTIKEVFPEATSMVMNKSYRSTWEITRFTSRITDNVAIEPMERHGEPPVVKGCTSQANETAYIRSLMEAFQQSDKNSLGIICKTQKQADKLHEMLKDSFSTDLLQATSASFGSGIVITTAHLAKGLEFDQVIVPFANAANYKAVQDRQMLYVACTRAMHRLYVTYTGEISAYLPKDSLADAS